MLDWEQIYTDLALYFAIFLDKLYKLIDECDSL